MAHNNTASDYSDPLSAPPVYRFVEPRLLSVLGRGVAFVDDEEGPMRNLARDWVQNDPTRMFRAAPPAPPAVDPVTGIELSRFPDIPLPEPLPHNEGSISGLVPVPNPNRLSKQALLGRQEAGMPTPSLTNLREYHVKYWRELRRWNGLCFKYRRARYAPRLALLGLHVPSATEVAAAAAAAVDAAALADGMSLGDPDSGAPASAAAPSPDAVSAAATLLAGSAGLEAAGRRGRPLVVQTTAAPGEQENNIEAPEEAGDGTAQRSRRRVDLMSPHSQSSTSLMADSAAMLQLFRTPAAPTASASSAPQGDASFSISPRTAALTASGQAARGLLGMLAQAGEVEGESPRAQAPPADEKRLDAGAAAARISPRRIGGALAGEEAAPPAVPPQEIVARWEWVPEQDMYALRVLAQYPDTSPRIQSLDELVHHKVFILGVDCNAVVAMSPPGQELPGPPTEPGLPGPPAPEPGSGAAAEPAAEPAAAAAAPSGEPARGDSELVTAQAPTGKRKRSDSELPPEEEGEGGGGGPNVSPELLRLQGAEEGSSPRPADAGEGGLFSPEWGAIGSPSPGVDGSAPSPAAIGSIAELLAGGLVQPQNGNL